MVILYHEKSGDFMGWLIYFMGKKLVNIGNIYIYTYMYIYIYLGETIGKDGDFIPRKIWGFHGMAYLFHG